MQVVLYQKKPTERTVKNMNMNEGKVRRLRIAIKDTHLQIINYLVWWYIIKCDICSYILAKKSLTTPAALIDYTGIFHQFIYREYVTTGNQIMLSYSNASINATRENRRTVVGWRGVSFVLVCELKNL